MKALSVVLACALLSLAPGSWAQDAPAGADTSGFRALVGQTIIGRDGEGQAALTYFSEDGDVKRVDGDREAQGEWTLRGETVCLTFEDADVESCYRVRVEGDMATFTARDGASRAYQIVLGDATRPGGGEPPYVSGRTSHFAQEGRAMRRA